MNDEVLVIVLYSRHAAPCADIMEILRPVSGIETLCVDTLDVRNIVISAEIAVVPALLVIDKSENLLKIYQDEDAFVFARYLRSLVDEEEVPPPMTSVPLNFTAVTGGQLAQPPNVPKVVAEKQQTLAERVEAMKAERAHIPE